MRHSDIHLRVLVSQNNHPSPIPICHVVGLQRIVPEIPLARWACGVMGLRAFYWVMSPSLVHFPCVEFDQKVEQTLILCDLTTLWLCGRFHSAHLRAPKTYHERE